MNNPECVPRYSARFASCARALRSVSIALGAIALTAAALRPHRSTVDARPKLTSVLTRRSH